MTIDLSTLMRDRLRMWRRSRAPGTRTILWAMATVAMFLSPPVAAQTLDDDLVPGGRFRLSVLPSFMAWDERFGTGAGEPGRVPLGADLTAADALSLFPGSAAWGDAFRTLAEDPTYAPRLGPVEGRVSHDVTRIDFGAHLGLTSWLTVGAMLPRVKTRSMVDLIFTPDTAAVDLGVNPRFADPVGVDAFLTSADAAATEARARADALCAAGDPSCAAASDLADRARRLESAARVAYAGPFFPRSGSAPGAGVSAAFAALDTDLRSAGLSGLAQPPVLAEDPLGEAGLEAAALFGPMSYEEPLTSRTGLWAWGDMEVTATARLLQLGSADRPARLTLLGGVLVRLATGSVSDPDIPFDLGSGDGQVDVEGRAAVHARPLDAMHLRVAARYGTQRERTVVRRVAPPGAALAPATARAELRWSPASYHVFEAEPFLRLTPALHLGATYHRFSKGADRYAPIDGAPDPDALRSMEAATRRTTHDLGVALVYDSVERWRSDSSVRPMQIHVRFLAPVGGVGGRVPADTRLEVGIRLLGPLPGIS